MQDRIKTREHNLEPCFDARKSFYGKAQEIEYLDGEQNDCLIKTELRSYSTIVACVKRSEDGCHFTAEVYGWYSDTTGRHIKEFLKQHGFIANNKSQILKM